MTSLNKFWSKSDWWPNLSSCSLKYSGIPDHESMVSIRCWDEFKMRQNFSFRGYFCSWRKICANLNLMSSRRSHCNWTNLSWISVLVKCLKRLVMLWSKTTNVSMHFDTSDLEIDGVQLPSSSIMSSIFAKANFRSRVSHLQNIFVISELFLETCKKYLLQIVESNNTTNGKYSSGTFKFAKSWENVKISSIMWLKVTSS